MSRNRLMLLLAALTAVVVIAGGFFLGVRPQLDRAAAASVDAEGIESTNAVTRAELSRLREQAKTLAEQQTTLGSLRASVPASASTSAFISALNATADQAGVKVSSITVGDAQAYTPPVTLDPTTTEAGGTESPTPSATPTVAAPGTTQVPEAPAPQTDSSITASNFSVIPVSVSVSGEFAEALAFVKGVQSGERLFLITSISSSMEAPGSTDAAEADAPTWSFGGSVYVLSDDTEATPTASPSATPTASPTATPAG
jgi:Tfp pilus assembly protein PilO